MSIIKIFERRAKQPPFLEVAMRTIDDQCGDKAFTVRFLQNINGNKKLVVEKQPSSMTCSSFYPDYAVPWQRGNLDLADIPNLITNPSALQDLGFTLVGSLHTHLKFKQSLRDLDLKNPHNIALALKGKLTTNVPVSLHFFYDTRTEARDVCIDCTDDIRETQIYKELVQGFILGTIDSENLPDAFQKFEGNDELDLPRDEWKMSDCNPE